MPGKFFTFLNPFLHFIDNGHFFRNPFKYLYMLIGLLFLAAPVYGLYQLIDHDLFDGQAKAVFLVLLVWVVIAFTCWLCFQVWWNRKDKIAMYSRAGDEFVATPVFSHFIQTVGETYGIAIGIIGFAAALAALVSDSSDEMRGLSRQLFPYGRGITGLPALLAMPIAGFLTIVIFRFFAELIRSLSAIANNTRTAGPAPVVHAAPPIVKPGEAQFEPADA